MSQNRGQPTRLIAIIIPMTILWSISSIFAQTDQNEDSLGMSDAYFETGMVHRYQVCIDEAREWFLKSRATMLSGSAGHQSGTKRRRRNNHYY